MCNVCNSNFSTATTSTCGYNSCNSYNSCGWSFLDSLFGGFNQTVCRDCNGCLRIRNRTCGCCSCGCHSCNSCGCNSCGCGNNNSDNSNGTSGNGTNGNFACLTYCGAVGNGATATSVDTDSYYARQYGLYPYNTSRSYGSGCGCGCNN